jgi:hypothetical protein
VTAETQTVRESFRRHGARCHGADGRGGPARDRRIDIPDFTSARWQAGRTEADLLAGILDGKGARMPSFRGKISDDEGRALAAHIRSLAPAPDRPGPGDPRGAGARADPGEEFRRLRDEVAELQRQLRALSPGSAGPQPTDPIGTGAPPRKKRHRPIGGLLPRPMGSR